MSALNVLVLKVLAALESACGRTLPRTIAARRAGAERRLARWQSTHPHGYEAAR